MPLSILQNADRTALKVKKLTKCLSQTEDCHLLNILCKNSLFSDSFSRGEFTDHCPTSCKWLQILRRRSIKKLQAEPQPRKGKADKTVANNRNWFFSQKHHVNTSASNWSIVSNAFDQWSSKLKWNWFQPSQVQSKISWSCLCSCLTKSSWTVNVCISFGNRNPLLTNASKSPGQRALHLANLIYLYFASYNHKEASVCKPVSL